MDGFIATQLVTLREIRLTMENPGSFATLSSTSFTFTARYDSDPKLDLCIYDIVCHTSMDSVDHANNTVDSTLDTSTVVLNHLGKVQYTCGNATSFDGTDEYVDIDCLWDGQLSTSTLPSCECEKAF